AEKEVGVLEVAQEAEVGGDAQGDEQLAPTGRGGSFDGAGEEEVQRRGDEDDQGQPVVPAGVEVVAGDQQEPYAHALPGQRPVEGEDRGEEDEEVPRTEEHRRASLPACSVSGQDSRGTAGGQGEKGGTRGTVNSARRLLPSARTAGPVATCTPRRPASSA